MFQSSILLTAFILLVARATSASPPEVTNLEVRQLPGSFTVEITYDLHDADGDLVDVAVMLSTDGGGSFPVRCRLLTGDVYQVPSGTGREILWDAGSEYPDFQGESCRLRLFASDVPTYPEVNLYRVENDQPFPLAVTDTVPYGHPLTVRWLGTAPIAAGLDPQILAQVDTVYPYDDGLLGYKWLIPGGDCIPEIEDCWQPRMFVEATGDSISFFGDYNQLAFNTPGHLQLPSGQFTFRVNTRDIVQTELMEYHQQQGFVVNYDPETYVLNGETDPAHPEDPQVYPYYIQLNDPAQTRHPFQAGDRIPDRTYVVFKALYRDDPRDLRLDPDQAPGLTGYFRGITGLNYTFQSQAADIDREPAWPADQDGWCADTLGFMPAPNCDFTMNLQGVDEHGRRDGTPASLEFTVGYPPCVQCVEILPGPGEPSAFDPDLDCYDGSPGDHPCFTGDPTVCYIKAAASPTLPDRDYLPQVGTCYLAIDKSTLQAEFTDTAPVPELYYSLACNVYRMQVLLHGRDDLREAWDEPLWRAMAWRYQMDYACDPTNSIEDGGGVDDMTRTTWGEDPESGLLTVDAATGLWKLEVEVVLPQVLVTTGDVTFYQVLLYTLAGGDTELADELHAICLRQLGSGTVRAMAWDQTRCNVPPYGRPAKYHVFQGVRPPEVSAGFTSWRPCIWTLGNLDFSLPLDTMAQVSSVIAEQPFQLILQQPDGSDLVCDPGAVQASTAQRPWHQR